MSRWRSNTALFPFSADTNLVTASLKSLVSLNQSSIFPILPWRQLFAFVRSMVSTSPSRNSGAAREAGNICNGPSTCISMSLAPTSYSSELPWAWFRRSFPFLALYISFHLSSVMLDSPAFSKFWYSRGEAADSTVCKSLDSLDVSLCCVVNPLIDAPRQIAEKARLLLTVGENDDHFDPPDRECCT